MAQPERRKRRQMSRTASITASRSALVSTIGPVSTLVLAALLLGEVMTPAQLAGAALVIVAILALEGKLPPVLRRLMR